MRAGRGAPLEHGLEATGKRPGNKGYEDKMIKLIMLAAGHLRRFRKDEEGLALTEYLILLGLLTGAVILAVIAFGDGLGTAWQAWGTWFTNESGELAPPAIPD